MEQTRWLHYLLHPVEGYLLGGDSRTNRGGRIGITGRVEDEAAEEVGEEELDLGHNLLTHKTECHIHGI